MEFSRLNAPIPMDQGEGRIGIVARHHPGTETSFRTRIHFAATDSIYAWFDLPLGSRVHRPGGIRRSGTGDRVLGLELPLQASAPSMSSPFALSLNLFTVLPNGLSKDPVRPGIIEGEHGTFASLDLALVHDPVIWSLEMGTGLAGEPGTPAKGGRIFAGTSLGFRLPGTGWDWSTESSLLQIEANWVEDPVFDRSFQDLGLSLSFPIGTWRIEAGYRRDFGSDRRAGVYYLGFSTGLF
ncbi:MAG TPA: hypothetical protein ENK02_04135 [Planctomycetes bacterium]|nr:hypothetical protein [Planctomycetota bacterium]